MTISITNITVTRLLGYSYIKEDSLRTSKTIHRTNKTVSGLLGQFIQQIRQFWDLEQLVKQIQDFMTIIKSNKTILRFPRKFWDHLYNKYVLKY